MAPEIGIQDEFERIYTEKFRVLASPFGEFIKYERDRAAIDVGLHLTRSRRISQTRVWFQLKGKRSSTLSADAFDKIPGVPLDLPIEHVRFWYASPEAVYLTVYVESKNLFLAEDVRDIVDRQWGEAVLAPNTFDQGQKCARVRVATSARLDRQRLEQLLKHRSLRIDGPVFRGRPLGHRLDPLRCEPNVMEPTVFTDVVQGLLAAHDYRTTETLDPSVVLPAAASSGDVASLTLGVMHCTFEWVLQMTTEFGFDNFDPGNDFRIEGQVSHIQGPCAVLIHSKVLSKPEPASVAEFAKHLMQTTSVRVFLVFANRSLDTGYFGNLFGSVRETELKCAPLHLGDLAFKLLTCTMVYLDFRDLISWRIANYLYTPGPADSP